MLTTRGAVDALCPVCSLQGCAWDSCGESRAHALDSVNGRHPCNRFYNVLQQNSPKKTSEENFPKNTATQIPPPKKRVPFCAGTFFSFCAGEKRDLQWAFLAKYLLSP